MNERHAMVSARTIFWEVDAQRDFMLPGGALYVPGAEKLIPNLDRLAEAARDGRVLLISSADAHSPEDPELHEWPPHCLKGSPGAQILPESLAERRLVIPNDASFALPADLRPYQQVTLEKNTLDVFDNPHADALLARIGPAGLPPFERDPLFVVFGVVTEYCVQCTVEGLLRRGRRIAVVSDAIESLDAAKAQQLLDGWQAHGVRLITTNQALSLAASSLAHYA
jgi:nicotinamidase/pyrazinamidase